MLLAQILTADSMWIGFDDQAVAIAASDNPFLYHKYQFFNNEADRWFVVFMTFFNMLSLEEKNTYRKMNKPYRY